MKLRFEARKFFSLGISELTEDLIYELVPPEGEVQTLELMDALLNSDFDKAYKYINRAFGASFLILSGLLSLTFRLYLLHLLTLKGLDKEKALTSLELRPPLLYKFQSYLKVPMARIKRLLELLALAERDIKLNLKDPSYALRLAVIKFIIYEKFSKVQGD
ncbi:MAG: hypothetical protein RMJ32_03995 [Aquificaceae bacterium]|nr:hypothetical protein [Aquificaceae bacterium]